MRSIFDEADPTERMTIDPAEIADLIEDGIPDAVARVTTPRVHDDEDEDAHFAAWVVSPAFEGESLVDQHQRVYDAVGDHMTRSVHALEIKTYTPKTTRNTATGPSTTTSGKQGCSRSRESEAGPVNHVVGLALIGAVA